MSPRLGRIFWWLWTGSLLSALAMFVGPFLALYLTSRGLRPSHVGLVASCFGLGAFLAGPVAGALADAAPAVGPAVLEVLGPRALWLGCLALGCCAAVGFLAWGRALDARAPPAAAPI